MYESIRVKPCKFLKNYQGFAKNKDSNEEDTNNTYASHLNGGMHYTESLTYDFQKRIQGESLHEAISASRFSV